ncbi:Os05g0208500, partial [Oryza sativa Japonica Group]
AVSLRSRATREATRSRPAAGLLSLASPTSPPPEQPPAKPDGGKDGGGGAFYPLQHPAVGAPTGEAWAWLRTAPPAMAPPISTPAPPVRIWPLWRGRPDPLRWLLSCGRRDKGSGQRAAGGVGGRGRRASAAAGLAICQSCG